MNVLFSSSTDIDDCFNVSCANGGTCIDEVEGYTCECAAGWNGTNCESGTSPLLKEIV